MLPAIEWRDDRVVMIDQRKLPGEEVYVECRNYEDVAEAIEKMVIRGAPAIGVAAAFGVALGFSQIVNPCAGEEEFARISSRLERTRPTARNLFWALERMKAVFTINKAMDLDTLKLRLIQEALTLEKDDVEINKRIGRAGAELIKDGDAILTHCNAGGLATAGYGTALGVIRAAFEQGKSIRVFAGETRPYLQGARLTAWELSKLGIPCTVITDNTPGWLMRRGEVNLAVVGADRIVRNGDTANKIGTYSLAVLAKENNVPFYVAAPLSTFDFTMETGEQIPIEERPPEEVKEILGRPITLPGVHVRNPAFDVTPPRFITAFITEKGTFTPPENKLPFLVS
jgi:methylthioribose-1-phosphate isomerase